MQNPALNRKGFKIYVLIWFIIISGQTLLLYFFFGQNIWSAVADSVIYNVLFALLAPGLWFVVNFAGLNKDELSLVATHLAAAIFSIATWVFFAGLIAHLLLRGDDTYVQFRLSTLTVRYVVGFIYYVIIVLIFYLIKYYQNVQERATQQAELEGLLKDAELRMLKSQINPHFIFNSLNSISSLTISKPMAARDMVVKLSTFLRYSLSKEVDELNPLSEEIAHVELYLGIEKVRFGDRLNFKISIDKAHEHVKVPNLILQPLLENAIKYGVYDSLEGVEIELAIHADEDMLVLELSNTYEEATNLSKGEGIGLVHVRKRLNLTYGRADLLKIVKNEGLFKVIMHIPLDHE